MWPTTTMQYPNAYSNYGTMGYNQMNMYNNQYNMMGNNLWNNNTNVYNIYNNYGISNNMGLYNNYSMSNPLTFGASMYSGGMYGNSTSMMAGRFPASYGIFAASYIGMPVVQQPTTVVEETVVEEEVVEELPVLSKEEAAQVLIDNLASIDNLADKDNFKDGKISIDDLKAVLKDSRSTDLEIVAAEYFLKNNKFTKADINGNNLLAKAELQGVIDGMSAAQASKILSDNFYTVCGTGDEKGHINEINAAYNSTTNQELKAALKWWKDNDSAFSLMENGNRSAAHQDDKFCKGELDTFKNNRFAEI